MRSNAKDPIDKNAWKLVDGYYWIYRVHETGLVERQLASGEWRPIKPGLVNGKLRVHMRLEDGRYKNVPVKNLVINAFLGGRKPGEVFGHRNRMVTDCSAGNLCRMTRSEVGKRYSGGQRRSIEKIDRFGNVIALYSSVSEASRENFIARRSIWMRCNNKLKGDPFASDGFSYRYEE